MLAGDSNADFDGNEKEYRVGGSCSFNIKRGEMLTVSCCYLLRSTTYDRVSNGFAARCDTPQVKLVFNIIQGSIGRGYRVNLKELMIKDQYLMLFPDRYCSDRNEYSILVRCW